MSKEYQAAGSTFCSQFCNHKASFQMGMVWKYVGFLWIEVFLGGEGGKESKEVVICANGFRSLEFLWKVKGMEE